MVEAAGVLEVELGFLPRSLAMDDPDHPGLLRAGPRAEAPYGGGTVERHRCRASDGTRNGDLEPDLSTVGFDVADLSDMDAIQDVCARVRGAGVVTDADAVTIGAALEGAELRLAGGSVVTVEYTSEEGFFMRKAGPNGLSVVGERSPGMNDHDVASSVHADQDVFGTPVRQLMGGRAPELFRHDSPDGSNHDAGLMLVNLWIPLQQITQPLALADGRSVDRPSHQLRYGLPTETFLERDDDMAINDTWTFLHDDAQRWYMRSEMDHRSAYVFNTLSTPHGACTLPGEAVAEQLYRTLEVAEEAVESGAVGELTSAVAEVDPAPPGEAPPALAEAIAVMRTVLEQARTDPAGTCGSGSEAWLAMSRAARRAVLRMSLEMRLVVSL